MDKKPKLQKSGYFYALIYHFLDFYYYSTSIYIFYNLYQFPIESKVQYTALSWEKDDTVSAKNVK